MRHPQSFTQLSAVLRYSNCELRSPGNSGLGYYTPPNFMAVTGVLEFYFFATKALTYCPTVAFLNVCRCWRVTKNESKSSGIWQQVSAKKSGTLKTSTIMKKTDRFCRLLLIAVPRLVSSCYTIFISYSLQPGDWLVCYQRRTISQSIYFLLGFKMTLLLSMLDSIDHEFLRFFLMGVLSLFLLAITVADFLTRVGTSGIDSLLPRIEISPAWVSLSFRADSAVLQTFTNRINFSSLMNLVSLVAALTKRETLLSWVALVTLARLSSQFLTQMRSKTMSTVEIMSRVIWMDSRYPVVYLQLRTVSRQKMAMMKSEKMLQPRSTDGGSRIYLRSSPTRESSRKMLIKAVYQVLSKSVLPLPSYVRISIQPLLPSQF